MPFKRRNSIFCACASTLLRARLVGIVFWMVARVMVDCKRVTMKNSRVKRVIQITAFDSSNA